MNLKKLNELIETGCREITLTEDVIIDDEKSLLKIKSDLTIDADNHDFINNISNENIIPTVVVDSKARLTLINCNFNTRFDFKCKYRTGLTLINCIFHNNQEKKWEKIECDIFSSLTLIDCDFREVSNTVISTDSTLIKIKNTLFDLDSSEIRSNDSAVEIMASDEKYLKKILKKLNKNNVGLYLVLDEFPDCYSSFTDLNELISKNDGEIVLQSDYLFDDNPELFDGIEIVKDNLVIDGNNHIINANGKSKVFNVTAQNITLKNIIFVNGYSIDGGVLKNHSNNLIVENCKFEGNCALNGGAVCNPEGNLKLVDCDFDKNYAFGLGGALYNGACCNMESASFDSNVVNDMFPASKNIKSELYDMHIGMGGAIYNGKDALIYGKNISFGFNEAMETSAIDNDGTIELNECNFEFNRSRGGAAICNGGILKIENSHFGENGSKYVDIYNIENYGTLELKWCEFDEGTYYESGDVTIFITSRGFETAADEEDYTDMKRRSTDLIEYYYENE